VNTYCSEEYKRSVSIGFQRVVWQDTPYWHCNSANFETANTCTGFVWQNAHCRHWKALLEHSAIFTCSVYLSLYYYLNTFLDSVQFLIYYFSKLLGLVPFLTTFSIFYIFGFRLDFVHCKRFSLFQMIWFVDLFFTVPIHFVFFSF
jgi:hypothetical protein